MADGVPLRVAQTMGRMDLGGVEAVVMGYYRAIDRARVQFDFLVDEGSSLPWRAEMESMGARIFVLPPPSHPLAYLREREDLFRRNGYAIVHAHINTLSVLPLRAAARAGVPVRICHSHSTAHPGEGARTLLKNALRPFSRRYATHLFACGEVAGAWLYGTEAMTKGRVTILRNAINVARFAFSGAVRDETRAALSLGKAPVLGHIGRFCYQKNHPFLLEVYARVREARPDAVLLLAGEGDGVADARERAQTLGVADGVRFLGPRSDAERLYAAMDVFLLPSYYEGLPVVGVEAQAAGLPCLFSEHVTQEAALLKSTRFLALDDAGTWAQAVLNAIGSGPPRAEAAQVVADQGFDITVEAGRLQSFYLAQADVRV